MAIMKDINEMAGHALKNRLVLFLSLVNVLVVVIGIFFIVTTGKTLQGDDLQHPQLSVSGEGKIFVRPDIATFTVTVVSDAARVGDAQNENSARSNAVVGFLKKQGVQEKDLKTVNYSVEPQYEYSNDRPCLLNPSFPCPAHTPPRIVSYQVRNSLEVKVRDLNKVDDLLQGVVTAGANEVGSVLFMVEDEKAALAEARRQAIEDAQQKAARLARDLSVRLKKIVGFSEGGAVPVYYARSGVVSTGAEAAPGPEVQPGEQEIRSNVTVTYEFK